MHAWVRGEVDTIAADSVRAHLDDCDTCRELITSLVQTRWVGQTVGRYRIVELVGGGAMGEVYRAEDPDLGRDVAIKLVQPGGSHERLLREAQAMARLTHPHVLRVYDVGVFESSGGAEDGVFFAMELVRGSTMRGWWRGRGWRELIEKLGDAGRGLAAAHASGLVHGDVKPDNILVDADGRVLVTDFGLARLELGDEALSGPIAIERSGSHALAAGSHTHTHVAGTPAYMAPEQLAGSPATPASDQFSFCVMLWEGLYGQRPFAAWGSGRLEDEGSSFDPPAAELAGIAGAQATPSPPRKTARGERVPPRLQRALRRGLSRAPKDRFPAMELLLGELDASRARRGVWIAAGAAGAAAIAATAVIATRVGGATCEDGADRLATAWGPEARAQVEAAFQRSGLSYAPTLLPTVLAALDRHRDAWIATYAETCKATQSEQLLDLRMACLARRQSELAALVTSLASGDKADVRESASAVAALPPVAQCADVASLEDVVKPPAEPGVRDRIAATTDELVRCRTLLATGRYKPGRTCALAAAARATEIGHGPLIAETEIVAGISAARLRLFGDADAAFTRGLLAAEASRDARARAHALALLVAIDGERGDFTRAAERAAHARAAIAGLGEDGGLTGDLAMATGFVGLRQGKLDDAFTLLDQAIAARKKRSGPRDPSVAEPLVALAGVHITRRKFDEARAALDEALAIQKAALGDEHPAIGRTLHQLSQLQARTGDLTGAQASQRRSYELLVAAYGEEHRDVALSIGVAAQALLLSGKYADAAPLARRSAELMEKVLGPDHPDTATTLATLSSVESRAGNIDAALAANQRVLAIRERTLPADHPHTQQAQVNLAMALRMKRRCAESISLLDKVIETRTRQLGADHADTVRAAQTRAACLIDVGRPRDALPTLEKVVASIEAGPVKSVDDRVTRATARHELARALWEADVPRRQRAADLTRLAHAELVELKDARARDIENWAKLRKLDLARPPKSTRER